MKRGRRKGTVLSKATKTKISVAMVKAWSEEHAHPGMRKGWQKKRVIIPCAVCQHYFSIIPCWISPRGSTCSPACAKIHKTGENSARWKGDKATYLTVHVWLNRQFGKADHCENSECPTIHPKTFEYANKSEQYTRNRSDYFQLCRSCHIRFDRGKLAINGQYKVLGVFLKSLPKDYHSMTLAELNVLNLGSFKPITCM